MGSEMIRQGLKWIGLKNKIPTRETWILAMDNSMVDGVPTV